MKTNWWLFNSKWKSNKWINHGSMNQTEIEPVITLDFILNRLFTYKMPYSINNLEKLQIVNNSKQLQNNKLS